MDARLARAEDVMSSQRARAVAGNLNLRAVYDRRPREAPFSFASFLLGEQKKRRFQKIKVIYQPDEHDKPKH